jgi:transcriptional regulator with XRE-family HTH domain
VVLQPSNPCVLLGQKVKELRAGKGMTQEELAERCEMFRTYLSRIESGQASPTLTALHGLAHGLGVSVLELLAPPEPGASQARVRSARPISRGRVRA